MEHGVVYHRNIIKSLFVVKVNEEKFSIFEAQDLASFDVGDQLYGPFCELGQQQILHSASLKWHKIKVHEVSNDPHTALGKVNFID